MQFIHIGTGLHIGKEHEQYIDKYINIDTYLYKHIDTWTQTNIKDIYIHKYAHISHVHIYITYT